MLSSTAAERSGSARWIVRLFPSVALLLLPLLAAASPAPQASAGPAVELDAYGRDSPRGLVSGVVASIGAADPQRAVEYLDLGAVPPGRRQVVGLSEAQRLELLLDQGGRLGPPTDVSDSPDGRLGDGLPTDEERIGALPPDGSGDPATPIVAVRRMVDGKQIWLISRKTLSSMPRTVTEAGWRRTLPRVLTVPVLGAPLVDWLVIGAAGAMIFLAVRLAFALVLRVLARWKRDREVGEAWLLIDAAASPLSMFATAALFLDATSRAGVSIVARAIVGQFVGGVLAVVLLWLLWRVVDAGASIVIDRMDRSERRRAKSTILFVRQAIRITLVAFGAIAVLATVGVNVTAGLAALGIGGIALALGAQKTIENVVGSVSIVADGVMRVGDLCRVGDMVGTVEQIGMRSTRFRTAQRTRVTIPNGALAAMQIENLALRDRFAIEQTVLLPGGLGSGMIERILVDVRAMLEADQKLAHGARATLKAIGPLGPEIELVGDMRTADAAAAARQRERILLACLRIVEASSRDPALAAVSIPNRDPEVC